MKRLHYFKNNSKNSLIEKYHLYKGEKLNWLQVTLRLERSIISVILPWVLFCTAYGILISFFYYLGLPIAFSNSSIITNAVLSFNIGFTLLLVFRTNTAHDRFWEGRQLWGALVNTSRNLTRGIWIIIKEKTPQDRVEKEAILRLVTAFAFAMKLHLRSAPLDTHLASLMSKKQYLQLQDTNHPSLQIAYWIGDYLQYQHDQKYLNVYQLTTLHNCVDDLVDILGGCERILKTPLPLIYTIKLRQLLLIFCLILPLEIVSFLNWWTGLIMAFVSFTLLSIEQIGSEIEEPFGFDPNDLPLNAICNTISNNVEELIRLASNNVRSC
ncbi:MAG: bestrophin family ion channel [Nostoc sp.]|uniref:bestrophin family protein n=1 Tax=Nostoc sp. TaxID=1180 RepID=UPI002FF95B52